MSQIFEIGGFRLDPDVGALTRDGRPTRLGARGVAVLTALVRRANAYVPKAALLDAAWPHAVVEEGNLAMQISAIRRVLADAGGAQWIETLQRRGYRFVGPVKLVDDPALISRAQRSNLPAALTSFVGRERELVEIKRLLSSKRLLTIAGAGGIGKTRIALQAGAEIVDAYPDGVWLAELASIRDPMLVASTVAHALGIAESTGKPAIESLRRYLKPRRALLILDNCEHLLVACAQLATTLLADARDATIVATSREPLRVAGEQTFALQPLSLPEPGSNLEALRRSEAVALFVERVQLQMPGFALTADRAHAVTEICIHLDGIPLALELAAARAESLSIEQISDRLADRLRLLTSGSRTTLPRQQTLRATLDWSHDLLTEDERCVLRRLAIFPLNFTIEAASAVASNGRIDRHAVIELVSRLVARSLVIADITGNRARYRLLESTRAYALEKLVEAAEFETLTLRHAQFMRHHFERAPNDWLRMSDAEWDEMYAAELAGVREALDWAFGADGDTELGIALAGASGALWPTLGLFDEGMKRLEEAAGRIDVRTPESVQARLWHWLGRALDEVPVRARPALERSVELYRRLGDASGVGIALMRLARVLALMGEVAKATAGLAEARPLLERAAPPQALAYYFFNLAFLNAFTGDLLNARDHYQRALAIYREAGHDFAALSATCNLANVNWGLGDLDAAEATLREQEAVLRRSRFGTRRPLGFALMNLSGVLVEKGELGEALALAREGLPLVRESGSAWLFADHLALRAAYAGELAKAARLAGYADAAHGANGGARQFIEARARDRLHEILRDSLAPRELSELLGQGASMSEDEASRLALEA